jgi:hypothetical protein
MLQSTGRDFVLEGPGIICLVEVLKVKSEGTKAKSMGWVGPMMPW